MNKADVVAALRKRADEIDTPSAFLSATALLSAPCRVLALAIEQGGGCECDDGQKWTQDCFDGIVWKKCEHCHGTGISPELTKLLAELGVGDAD